MKSKKLFLLLCVWPVLLLSVSLNCFAEQVKPDTKETRWNQLKSACQKCYGGWDYDVDFSFGARERFSDQETKTEPYGSVTVKIPLLSKDNRIKRKESMRSYLKEGSTYISIIESSETSIKLYSEHIESLQKLAKQILPDDGIQSAQGLLEKITSMREKILDVQSKREEAMLKLEGHLLSCEGK